VKFYVGTTFTRYREARALIDTLHELGHECVEDWTRTDQFDDSGQLKDSERGGYAMMDHWPEGARVEKAAIKLVADTAGFCIFLAEEPSRGHVTEYGIAIGTGVPNIIVVAPWKLTIFDALPEVTLVDFVQSAVALIETYHGHRPPESTQAAA
jgi:hypothetical protein